MRTNDEKKLMKQLGISKAFRQYAKRYGGHDVYSIQQVWKQLGVLKPEQVPVNDSEIQP